MSPKLQVAGTLVEAASQAARRATEYLTGIQAEQGYWWAELTADTTLESDYILLQLWLHPPVDGVWNPPTRPLIDKASGIDSRAPVARWRIQHLSAGAHRSQRDSKGLFRAETRRAGL